MFPDLDFPVSPDQFNVGYEENYKEIHNKAGFSVVWTEEETQPLLYFFS